MLSKPFSIYHLNFIALQLFINAIPHNTVLTILRTLIGIFVSFKRMFLFSSYTCKTYLFQSPLFHTSLLKLPNRIIDSSSPVMSFPHVSVKSRFCYRSYSYNINHSILRYNYCHRLILFIYPLVIPYFTGYICIC